MSLKDKKVFRLIEYAEKLGIRDEVMKYVRFKRPVSGNGSRPGCLI